MAVSWCHCSILFHFGLKFNHSLCHGLWGWFCFLSFTLSLSAVQHSALRSLPCHLNKPSTFWIHAQSGRCPSPPQLTSVNKMLRGTCMATLPAQDTSVPDVTANTTLPGVTSCSLPVSARAHFPSRKGVAQQTQSYRQLFSHQSHPKHRACSGSWG